MMFTLWKTFLLCVCVLTNMLFLRIFRRKKNQFKFSPVFRDMSNKKCFIDIGTLLTSLNWTVLMLWKNIINVDQYRINIMSILCASNLVCVAIFEIKDNSFFIVYIFNKSLLSEINNSIKCLENVLTLISNTN